MIRGMDIVVTIPKSRMAEVEEEERQVAEAAARGEKMYYYWTLGRKPVQTKPGDRCYFVWDGAVRAWHEILQLHWDNDMHRWCVWMRPEIHTLKTPIPMASFRGFRYAGPELASAWIAEKA